MGSSGSTPVTSSKIDGTLAAEDGDVNKENGGLRGKTANEGYFKNQSELNGRHQGSI